MKAWVLLLALLVPGFAGANEATIRRVIEPKLAGARIESVQPSPLPGVWEVRFRSSEGLQIVYTDAEATHLFIGNLYDTKADRNLTEARIRQLTAINFNSLPSELSFKIQRGTGRRVLAVFADPYCPACQQFEKELAQIDDVTIHIYMMPVIRPELADHSRAVWCSGDRPKAWLDLALHRRKPSLANVRCDNPIDKVIELGHTLKIRATPTLFFANGERVSGGLPVAKLRAMLDEAGASKPAR